MKKHATNAIRALLDCRVDGHWVGELSSSALSTATAIIALKLAQNAAVGTYEPVVLRGAQWLLAHQNADGGWGDTIISFSNISTTALCWAALSVAGNSEECRASIQAAELWLSKAAGGLAPEQLAGAIARVMAKIILFRCRFLRF